MIALNAAPECEALVTIAVSFLTSYGSKKQHP
jgi:hypothetical protein